MSLYDDAIAARDEAFRIRDEAHTQVVESGGESGLDDYALAIDAYELACKDVEDIEQAMENPS